MGVITAATTAVAGVVRVGMAGDGRLIGKGECLGGWLCFEQEQVGLEGKTAGNIRLKQALWKSDALSFFDGTEYRYR